MCDMKQGLLITQSIILVKTGKWFGLFQTVKVEMLDESVLYFSSCLICSDVRLFLFAKIICYTEPGLTEACIYCAYTFM
jgi:hypothetical protein